MSRGIIYHFGLISGIENFGEMDETDFYGQFGTLGVDGIWNQPAKEAKKSVGNLVARLWSAGFKVKLSTDPIYEDFHFFNTGNEAELIACKSKYFAVAFNSLKEMVHKMSLETFSADGPEEFIMRTLINNKAGDLVYFGNVYEDLYSLDSFVRGLRPDTGYFIAPETVYMH